MERYEGMEPDRALEERSSVERARQLERESDSGPERELEESSRYESWE